MADRSIQDDTPEYVEVDVKGVRVERSRQFGGCWLGLRLLRDLGLNELLETLLRTRTGIAIRKRCISRPSEHQAILLHRLGLELPTHIEIADM